jgi:hypothetical protein
MRWSWVLYGFAVLACGGIVAALLSNAGLCVPEGRFLSEKDYFKGAIEVVIRDPVDGVGEEVAGGVIYKLVHSQRYSDADEFLKENPNCCKFIPANSGDGGAEIAILDRLSGARAVEVSYDKRYVSETGQQKTSRVRAPVVVTSCGKGRSFR